VAKEHKQEQALLRQEDARKANIFLKKADDEKSIIDLINETEALIERQEMRERIKNRGIEANRKQQRLIIATSVDEALREYDRETNTGFSSYFTIQSSESMNAKAYLQRISSNLNDKKDTERLVNAILWLLDKGGKQPNDLSNRLKIGSRFYIKLSDSYTKWCVFLPDQGILS
jgi:hypothetical protein